MLSRWSMNPAAKRLVSRTQIVEYRQHLRTCSEHENTPVGSDFKLGHVRLVGKRRFGFHVTIRKPSASANRRASLPAAGGKYRPSCASFLATHRGR